jgi:hypothetical protein
MMFHQLKLWLTSRLSPRPAQLYADLVRDRDDQKIDAFLQRRDEQVRVIDMLEADVQALYRAKRHQGHQS